MAERAGPRLLTMMRGAASITVVSTSHMSDRASAISRPTNPAPMTTAFSTPPAVTAARMDSAASRWATTWTPGRSWPGTGRTRGAIPWPPQLVVGRGHSSLPSQVPDPHGLSRAVDGQGLQAGPDSTPLTSRKKAVSRTMWKLVVVQFPMPAETSRRRNRGCRIPRRRCGCPCRSGHDGIRFQSLETAGGLGSQGHGAYDQHMLGHDGLLEVRRQTSGEKPSVQGWV
jgi:hypothetical protein